LEDGALGENKQEKEIRFFLKRTVLKAVPLKLLTIYPLKRSV
jgi:hypothetical protein